MKNFKLTTETKVNLFGITLFRIEATASFRSISIGERGGWVESEKNLSGDARVSGNAWVSGDARVSGNAWVYGDARVYGNAWVYGNARVYGDAREKSPLQIQGSRHFLCECKKGVLEIGCKEFGFQYWKDHFKSVGVSEGYSEIEIREYELYINLAIDLSNIVKP